MTNITKISKRKPHKFTGRAKMAVAALSILSFVGSWDLIARSDQNYQAQANKPTPLLPTAYVRPPTPTPWPAIPSLAEIPPIPTLAPTLTLQYSTLLANSEQGEVLGLNPEVALFQPAPVPTLVPLPTLAPLPSLPAPPPAPPIVSAGGGNHSGGS
jgi:hypothetical protein